MAGLLDQPDFGSRKATLRMQQERQDANRVMHGNRLEERAYRRAYRQAVRNQDYGGALDVVQQSRQAGVNFSGIRRSGSDYSTAVDTVRQQRHAVDRYSGSGASREPQFKGLSRLDAIQEEAGAQADREYAALQDRVTRGEERAARLWTPERAGEADQFAREVMEMDQVDPSQRLGLRQRLAGFADHYSGLGNDAINQYGGLFRKLGIDPALGDRVMRDTDAGAAADYEDARNSLSIFNRDNRTSEIAREREANYAQAARRAGGLNSREARSLLSRI